MEDNTFDFANQGNGAYDAYNGARYVFRYNWVTNTCANHHGCDSGGSRSPHTFEIYNNYFTANNLSDRLSWFFEFRGGSGVVFNNTCQTSKGNLGRGIFLRVYRCFNNYSPWGAVTGSNPYDGNTDGTGYPALDQPGRTGPTAFNGGSSSQVLSPIYTWGNTFNGASMGAAAGSYANSFGGGSEAQLIQSGRDYYNNTVRPGYVPLAYPHPLVSATGGRPGTTNAIITVSGNNTDFGILRVGTSSNLSFTVRNSGGSTLVGAATAVAPFSVISGGAYSLGSNQSQTVTVRYTPTLMGQQDGTVTFTGGGNSTLQVSGAAWSVLPGLSFSSTAGLVLDPFVSNAGAISQPAETGVADGGQAIYAFNITSAGDYTITGSVSAPDANANSFFLNIDGQPADPSMIWDVPPTTGFTNQVVSWRGTGSDTVPQFSPKVFTLSAGTHQLIVRGREANVQLGAITITSVGVRPAPPTNLRVVGVQ